MGKQSEETPHQKDILMASTHMKRYFISDVAAELQMKTVGYYHTPVRMAKNYGDRCKDARGSRGWRDDQMEPWEFLGQQNYCEK